MAPPGICAGFQQKFRTLPHRASPRAPDQFWIPLIGWRLADEHKPIGQEIAENIQVDAAQYSGSCLSFEGNSRWFLSGGGFGG